MTIKDSMTDYELLTLFVFWLALQYQPAQRAK